MLLPLEEWLLRASADPRDPDLKKVEKMRQAKINIHRPGTLLALFAVGVLVTGLLALVSAKATWAASRSFEPASNSPFPVGLTPTTVTNADFNGDGKMDLATQNAGSNSVSVRLGDGDGTFQPKQDFAVGSGPTSVTSADFNGDNKADLAVSNQFSNSVSLLRGNGDGTFQPKQDFAAGSGPTSVISADFNEDSYADLAVANYSSNTVSVLLGQDSNGDGKGDGTFQAAGNFSVDLTCSGFCIPATAAPNQVITADFNGDAKADLATANIGSCGAFCTPGGVSVLLGNGNGSFQNARLAKSNAAITSIDTYNSRDIVATEYNSNVVSVLRSNADGTFSAGQQFPVGSNPSSVTSTDLDADGVADLAVSNFASDNVSVLWGNSSGGFQSAQNSPAGDGPAFVIGARLNVDDFADLAVANQNSNNVSVLLNTAQDTTPPTIGSVSPPDVATGIALTTNVQVTFSEAMDRATLASSTFTLKKQNSSTTVAATVNYDPNTGKATLDPGSDLAPNTIYIATVKGGPSGAKDAAGNALQQDYSWTFTTAPLPPPPPPTVAGYTPTQTTGVPRNIRPTATFSTNMDGTTVTATSIKLQVYNRTTKKWASVAHTVSYNAATATATVTPGSRLGASRKYRVTVTTGAKSSAGVALDQDASTAGNQPKRWTFTTGST
jgi:Bacterial Ig-like domain/FG-GAP-like repeat